MGIFFVLALTILIQYVRRIPEHGYFSTMPQPTEDPRPEVMGLFLVDTVETEIPYLQSPEDAVEVASNLPGDTAINEERRDPITGDTSFRTICVISGNYTFNLDQ